MLQFMPVARPCCRQEGTAARRPGSRPERCHRHPPQGAWARSRLSRACPCLSAAIPLPQGHKLQQLPRLRDGGGGLTNKFNTNLGSKNSALQSIHCATIGWPSWLHNGHKICLYELSICCGNSCSQHTPNKQQGSERSKTQPSRNLDGFIWKILFAAQNPAKLYHTQTHKTQQTTQARTHTQ